MTHKYPTQCALAVLLTSTLATSTIADDSRQIRSGIGVVNTGPCILRLIGYTMTDSQGKPAGPFQFGDALRQRVYILPAYEGSFIAEVRSRTAPVQGQLMFSVRGGKDHLELRYSLVKDSSCEASVQALGYSSRKVYPGVSASILSTCKEQGVRLHDNPFDKLVTIFLTTDKESFCPGRTTGHPEDVASPQSPRPPRVDL